MTFILERMLPNAQPIYVDENNLYLLRGNRIFRSDLELRSLTPFARLHGKRPLQRRMAPSLIRRVLRLVVRASIACEGALYLAIKDEIYRIDLVTGEATLDFRIPKGLSLLNLSVVIAEGGSATVCFGEYSANAGRGPVRVWARSHETPPDWRPIELFGAQDIEHIHNIRQLADGHLAILTGDFDKAASIWRCASDFTGLERWSPPGQAYRACWFWEAPDGGLWWATDSQFIENSLMTVGAGMPISAARPASALPGSCIYWAMGKRFMAFSTTVEPGATSQNAIMDLLTRAPGPGIFGQDSVIYVLVDGHATEVLRATKDHWPLRLAQFGTFHFPSGRLPTGRIYAYGVGVNGYDNVCLSFRQR